jgi:hypothetical protein
MISVSCSHGKGHLNPRIISWIEMATNTVLKLRYLRRGGQSYFSSRFWLDIHMV